jgi:hypothetical protein
LLWYLPRSRYRPLYFRSRIVDATELLAEGVAGVIRDPMQQPVYVTVEVTASGTHTSTLVVPAPLEPYRIEPGHGNEKVCRNQHGDYQGGTCYYRYYLRAMCVLRPNPDSQSCRSCCRRRRHRCFADPSRAWCILHRCFSVTPLPGSSGLAWEFDPETPRAGCDVYDDWAYGQYAKDVRTDDLFEQGQFSFIASVRHGDDPIEIARDQTHLQMPGATTLEYSARAVPLRAKT